MLLIGRQVHFPRLDLELFEGGNGFSVISLTKCLKSFSAKFGRPLFASLLPVPFQQVFVLPLLT